LFADWLVLRKGGEAAACFKMVGLGLVNLSLDLFEGREIQRRGGGDEERYVCSVKR